jgi:cyanophycinase-like exopeptidase
MALVGSGEYLPVMDEVERELMAGRPARFVQLATAAAPEGLRSLTRWHDLGRLAAERMGAEQVVLPVTDRASADSAEVAALVGGAGLVYLSGGSPTFLAKTLRDTAVWRAIEAAWQAGAALAGCSAGAMALTNHVPDLRHPTRPAAPGLAAVPHLRVIPHFDRFVSRIPRVLLKRIVETPQGVTVIGIDEDTALVGGPDEWVVRGRQSVWVLTPEGREQYAAGLVLVTPRG